MNRANPRRKRRYIGAMPSDCPNHTNTVAGDGGHHDFTEFDKDVLPEPKPAKVQRISGNATEQDKKSPTSVSSNSLDKCHRFSVLVTSTDYFKKSESEQDPLSNDLSRNSTRRGSAKPEKMELRFYCKLKDLWTDKYTRIGPKRRRRHRKITTGDPKTDKVLTNLELQGYGMIELLSKGKFSSVVVSYSQIQRTNVALKFSRILTARRTDIRTSDALAEARCSCDDTSYSAEMFLYDRLQHSNIVKMHEYYIINGQVILSLDFCENGSMKQLIELLPGKFLTEPIAHRYFIQMLSAMEYIHRSYIVHRDIATEHFLVDHLNNLKLCDFSLAEEYKPGDALFTDRCGTRGYVAPEVLEKVPSYSPVPVDVWALGSVLFEMTTGKCPFNIIDPCATFTDEERHKIHDDMGGNDFLQEATKSVRLSLDIRELLKGVFQRKIANRYTLNRILYSDWVQKRPPSKPHIGNYYMIQQPQKTSDSRRENALKKQFDI